ncbi:MAG TPA: ABC transporter ATP-binding protein [Myxococcota bacterium]|nr:ABC transporter ATP-binding protein [Myxococcota bacterium]
MSLLSVQDLKVHFPVYSTGLFRRVTGQVKAVDGLSFDIERGEILGLVGESGCGKSTTGRAVLRLLEPTSGRVTFDGTDVSSLAGTDLRRFRRRAQIIFQDPYASLNPRMTVGAIITEPLKTHGLPGGLGRAQELMELTGLDPRFVRRYPHEFSGGQRQRIGIARALASEPELIVCDEPISALDVSIQAQILNLLQDLARDRSLSYLFIAHDLSAIRHVCDRIAVMYLGRLAEVGTFEQICDGPRHPYTQALVSAVPVPDPVLERQRERIVLTGDVPSPLSPPPGCRFHTRCHKRQQQRCDTELPELRDLEEGRRAACHWLD